MILGDVRSAHRRRRFSLLNNMRRWIRGVIGSTPDLHKIYSHCNFGPGASVGVHGNTTNLARKLLAEEWTCTPTALPYAIAALSNDEHMFELLLKDSSRSFVCLDVDHLRKVVVDKVRLVQHNKITTVPKTAIIDRTIAIEPLLNGYLQAGVDEYLKLRLKRIGIDLRDQTRNQDLARQGSIPGQSDPFVTIDLSSASDSISVELARRVLPHDWFYFLNQLRSPCYRTDDGVERRYQKFTSMGNGFCFPLETLIFASVCACYSDPNDFTVYGDDIICRRSVAQNVLKDLYAIGFRHNTDKTFLEGPFRESCGADWYEGLDVRPLALDYELNTLENLIKLHNMSKRKPLWHFAFRSVRSHLLNLVPDEVRLVRPYYSGDFGAFEVELDMFQSSRFATWNREFQSWRWAELVTKPKSDDFWKRDGRASTLLAMAAVRGLLSHKPFTYRRKTTQSVRMVSHGGGHSTWLPPSAK